MGNLSGNPVIFHDSKTAMHRLDDLGLSHGETLFDTALAAYDLNPSQSDYPVSKLATNFLGTSVEDEDAAGCAEALWNLRPFLEEELEKRRRFFHATQTETGRWVLTPKGFLVSNDIITDLLLAQDGSQPLKRI